MPGEPWPLDRYDPWPLRIVLISIGIVAFVSVIGITVLLANDKEVQGFFTIPVSAITALAMAVPRRPPWTARSVGRRDTEDV